MAAASWKKVIVSGSIAELNNLSVDNNVNVSGSLNVGANQQIGQSSAKLSGSFSGSFSGALTSSLANVNQPNIVSYDTATGTFSYQGTGSFTATTASYILSSGVDGPNGMNSILTASYAATGDGTFSGSFSGSFQGDGGGLTNVPASGIVGLQLNQIGSGSVTASIAPDLGFRVNTNTQITGSLNISSSASTLTIEGNGFAQTYFSTNGALVLNPGSGGVGMAGTNQYMTVGYIVGQTAGTQLTGSFTGSFTGTTNLPDLTQGDGITAFTYDGSTTATVAVSGAAALSTNAVTKWSGDAFVDSSITDSTNVTINNAGGVLVQTGGLYVTGSSTFHDSVFIEGNLTVAGTASFQHSDNLAIADQFILLNSGSSTFQDSGFIVNTGNTGNSGSAFFLETAGTTVGTSSQNGRFAVAGNVQPNTTTVTAEEYAVTAIISGSAPGATVPQFGGTNLGQGNMWVDSNSNDIWIYA